jgi:hypothetical protein
MAVNFINFSIRSKLRMSSWIFSNSDKLTMVLFVGGSQRRNNPVFPPEASIGSREGWFNSEQS